METLQYKIIKTEAQYWDYCNRLEELVIKESNDQETEEEIDLLTLLIEKWDGEHNTLGQSEPVEALKYLMAEHHLKANMLADLLGVSKSFISEVLNYKKRFSKENIRKLANHFKVKQELFNQPYQLKILVKPNLKNARIKDALKPLHVAQ